MAQDTYAVTHVMADIETLGVRPGSVILSVGAVAFDPYRGTLGPEFSTCIDPVESQAAGLTIDAGTVRWWMQQDEAARMRAMELGDTPHRALTNLAIWIEKLNAPRRIWSHGATFDPVMLDAAFDRLELRKAWSHRDVRDTRTLYDLAGIEDLSEFRSPGDVHHDALSDARTQAWAVIAAYRSLGLAQVMREAAHG